MDDKLAVKIERCGMEIASNARAYRASEDEKDMLEANLRAWLDRLESLMLEI